MIPNRIVMFTVIAIVGVACGGGDGTSESAPGSATDPESTPVMSQPPDPAPVASTSAPIVSNDESVEVVSDDGRLTLTVPAGAMPAGTAITVTRVGDANRYELEPSGLEFSVPAVARLRVDVEPEWDDGTPIFIGVLTSVDGSQSTTGRNIAERDGDIVVVEADVEHFSTLEFFGGSVHVQLVPSSVSTSPDSEFEATLRAGEISDEFRAKWLLLHELTWGSAGEVAFVSATRENTDDEFLPRYAKAKFKCAAGTGRYGVSFSLSNSVRQLDETDWDAIATILFVNLVPVDAEDVLSDTEYSAIMWGDADCTGTGCELDPSDPSRPSIGRIGTAAAEVAPEIVGEANTREIGQAIAQEVDDGTLCLEEVVTLYEDRAATPVMLGAIERAAG